MENRFHFWSQKNLHNFKIYFQFFLITSQTFSVAFLYLKLLYLYFNSSAILTCLSIQLHQRHYPPTVDSWLKISRRLVVWIFFIFRFFSRIWWQKNTKPKPNPTPPPPSLPSSLFFTEDLNSFFFCCGSVFIVERKNLWISVWKWVNEWRKRVCWMFMMKICARDDERVWAEVEGGRKMFSTSLWWHCWRNSQQATIARNDEWWFYDWNVDSL